MCSRFSFLDMRPYTDHHVKAVSLATAEICVESRGGGGVHRKDDREQSIVIVKRVDRQTWLPRENRLCTHCSNRVVEHEFLFLTECNKYNNIREFYFSRTEDICSGFIKMKREEKSLLGETGEYKDLISLYLLSCHILRERIPHKCK